jgi:4-alpha-glucanotransferase
MHPTRLTDAYSACVAEALRALDKCHLVLGIHDSSYPSLPGEDTGYGSPYTAGGRRFIEFARALGFNGLQFGPQGLTSEDNPSPYASTLFSRNILSIALAELVGPKPWGVLLRPETLWAVVEGRPQGSQTRVAYRYAFHAHRRLLREAFSTFQRQREEGHGGFPLEALQAFRQAHQEWLVREALYAPLCRMHGAGFWHEWRTPQGEPHEDQHLWAPRPGEEEVLLRRREWLLAQHREELDFQAFCQFLVHAQHRALQRCASGLKLKLFGDLQIGLSAQDVWSYQALLLGSYVMGAPPSRTNPEGQTWNYHVLNPAQYMAPDGRPGPALRLVEARMNKLLGEFNGVRIDHPHGLVCPWVYWADTEDVLRAVQQGARLFSSPHLPDHPLLARFTIAQESQLNPGVPRYADEWVVSLTEEQVERYGVLFDAVVAAARRHGRHVSDLVCEVLSTQPYPLCRVMERYGLGRFRVTQKANPLVREDVYRSENAHPEDWVMVGNHDTKPLALLLETWARSEDAWQAQAAMLAEQLEHEPTRRASFQAALLASPQRMWEAKFADIFASRSRNVFVFFTDLYGLKDVYNEPGTVHAGNWSLRLPHDAERLYFERVALGEALNLPRVLALALRARGEAFSRGHSALVGALERQAAALEPSAP